MLSTRWLSVAGRAPVYYVCREPDAACKGTFVLLHGLASNATRWQEFMEKSRLSTDWKLLAPDLRGHGFSVDHVSQGPDQWADDIVALLDQEGVREAVILGHCLGATIAQRVTRRHPERVRGLILIEPMYPSAIRGALRRMRWFSPLIRTAVFLLRVCYRLGLRKRSYPRRDLLALDRETRERIAAGDGQEAVWMRYGAARHDFRYLPVANYLEALLATLAESGPVTDWPGPVLTLLSRGSALTHSHRTVEMLAALPACKVIQLDAEHWVPTECPDEMRAAIDSWIAETFSANDVA